MKLGMSAGFAAALVFSLAMSGADVHAKKATERYFMLSSRAMGNLKVMGVPAGAMKKLSKIKSDVPMSEKAFKQKIRSTLGATALAFKIKRGLTIEQLLLGIADTRIDQELAESQAPPIPLVTAMGEAAYNAAMKSGEYKYSGNLKCKLCHRKFFLGRQADAHEKTFRTWISGVFDAEPKCLPCHSTGYGIPTGFTDVTATKKLRDVTCEGCHGPGSKHNKLGKGGLLAGQEHPEVLKKMCVACHEGRRNRAYHDLDASYGAYKEAEAKAGQR